MRSNVRLFLFALVILLTASAFAGCGKTKAESDTKPAPVIERDLDSYAAVLASLPAGSWYAFADMSEEHDALLVTACVFDNLDGTRASTEATVYGFATDGSVVEYGSVKSGGTANPLAAKDGELFVGGHHYMNKVHIDEAASAMVTDEGEYFEEYGDAVVIAFSPVD